VFGHRVHMITGKCKILPVGAFVEDELHLVNAIVSKSIHFLLLLALLLLIVCAFVLQGNS
jgi:hypothetical protein